MYLCIYIVFHVSVLIVCVCVNVVICIIKMCLQKIFRDMCFSGFWL